MADTGAPQREIEIVPAILRNTFEKIEEDWNKVEPSVSHIHIDITDGIFAGEKGFLDILRFADLESSHKAELHMMVQTPGDFVDDIIDMNPGRCIFHIEAFHGKNDLPFVYNTVGEYTSAEMGLAINPDTDISRLTEYLPLIQYVLFMGYKPGRANQPIDISVFKKIQEFHAAHPTIKIAADGHVGKDTIEEYAKAGVELFCANTAIFGMGTPEENIRHLELLAQGA